MAAPLTVVHIIQFQLHTPRMLILTTEHSHDKSRLHQTAMPQWMELCRGYIMHRKAVVPERSATARDGEGGRTDRLA